MTSVTTLIDGKKIRRAAAFTKGSFAGSTVVGKARTQDGTPVTTTEVHYLIRNREKSLFINEAASALTSGYAGLKALANVRGAAAAFNGNQTATTIVMQYADRDRSYPPTAGRIAGVAQPVPDSTQSFGYGNIETTVAIDA